MNRNFSLMLASCCLFLYACDPEAPEAEPSIQYDHDISGWRSASISPFSTSNGVRGFAYGEVSGGASSRGGAGVYAAAAYGGILAYSYDGDKWYKAEVTPVVTNNFNAVAFGRAPDGSGLFVAAADSGRVAVSSDGVRWASYPEDETAGIAGFGTEDIKDIAFSDDDGVFVAVGGNGNVSVSRDGVMWEGGSVSDFAGNTINAIAYSKEYRRFFAGGEGGYHGWSGLPVSTGSWTVTPGGTEDGTPAFHTNSILDIAVGEYGNKIGVIVAFGEWSGKRIAICNDPNFANSAESGAWDADIDAGTFGSNSINAVAWAEGYFLAAGQSAMVGYWSGANPGDNATRFWRALTFREFAWWEISSLAALNGRFFIGNTGGKIAYSR